MKKATLLLSVFIVSVFLCSCSSIKTEGQSGGNNTINQNMKANPNINLKP